ncbi:metal-dependent hydrolase [Planotetraspora sp. A-T 1434]|uniref:metal-dependent hydrolase n=1 Tax=Planotetraspora sp. A-T 1434 TaxID=2979219 RepID=UPI0021BE8ADF|nr:metal-dependent hydrolase [Planotetraspora sp. A-T 1434]MCT9929496.1 metal-dependent hydrolase [Planotetraspora sp. A-T 1434]
MMGHSHALSGAAVWLAVTPALMALPGILAHPELATVTGTVLTPPELVAGAVICAGAAMLPDLDHPSATIAQTFGPATWLLSKGVNFVSGGHRHATHSLLFAVFAGVGTHLLVQRYPIGRDIMVVLMIGLALRAVGIGVPGHTITSALVNMALTAGLFVTFHMMGVTYSWLGFAIGVGCLVHVIGDCLTERGCPVLWPIKGRWLLPFDIGIKTGKTFEKQILGPVLSVAVLVLLCLRLMPA